MVDAGRLVWQLVKIVVGYAVAVAAAGLFLSWGFFRPHGVDADPVAFAATVGSGLISGFVIGGIAAIPAFAAILAAELLRLKSVIFHIAAGGLIGLGLWVLGDPAREAALRPGSTIALAAGFAAGLAYWLVAGRTSGKWRILSPRE
ncbi:translation initiation factor IF-3 [Stappia sp. F7233]|uniref:Translation initiation factor IF-3 n=1 Tax=Stappia albiluteola TaxID=2758565 RepID=A0A839AFE3_9HYPH|nr:translation initiation factor IF-3 [Stappia albiluteola]MBA5778570.1 translation initiation factor IF-3 [Stappia albiluteola]